jgi:hypothetical protein
MKPGSSVSPDSRVLRRSQGLSGLLDVARSNPEQDAESPHPSTDGVGRGDVDLGAGQFFQNLGHRTDPVIALHQERFLRPANLPARLLGHRLELGAVAGNEIQLGTTALGKGVKGHQVHARPAERTQGPRSLTRLVRNLYVIVVDHPCRVRHDVLLRHT